MGTVPHELPASRLLSACSGNQNPVRGVPQVCLTLMFGAGPEGEVVLVDGYPVTMTFDGSSS